MKPFTISCDNIEDSNCQTGIIVKKDLHNGEYDILLLNCSSDKEQKHKLHALSQIALYQFEDDEIDVYPLDGCCCITADDFDHSVAEGLVLIQDQNNSIKLYAHPSVPVRKCLDNAYRYCTRWIRLDI